eukprot:TRINITY_DN33587_c0_g1_i1.p1 TRINITY_DN33587_c0_g1~~TRINITY_DN33587_c0_g1_i1.p1  ORF type:complete len:390 (-),score=43.58 TRINITY_DN33587_c0_g1_i1:262-1431(-)
MVCFRIVLLIWLTFCRSEASLQQGQTIRIFKVNASTLYDAGVQQGHLAANLIRAWHLSDEMQKVSVFAKGEGRKAFENLKHASTKAFPHYADEIRGIANGSGLEVDSIWHLNLISELEGMMGERASHCSDVFAVSRGGYKAGFGHGHNEDWPGEVKNLFYFVEITALPGADFESCAGLSYPGTLVGWSPTWNSHGMYMTQNSLFPKDVDRRGHDVSSVFIQRNAICGKAARQGVIAIERQLSMFDWSGGASVNLVDLKTKRMRNIELYRGEFAGTEVDDEMGNYSHFNMYKELIVSDIGDTSTLHRQARVDSLPPPRTTQDIKKILSDIGDGEYPIFRDMTLTTLILDGTSGRLDAWCCGVSAASGAKPLHSWSLLPATDSASYHTMYV